MVTRRKFGAEFKREAVNLVVGRGVTVAQAARDLDLHENLLRRWIQETRQGVAPGKNVRGSDLRADAEEIARLRKEVSKLKMERDILKEAAAFFAKEST